MNVLFVAVGGGLGAAARYLLQGVVYRFTGAEFPYGTLVVNVLGCFLIGVMMASLEERFVTVPSLRIFLSIGVLGGFTTFSSFSYESLALLQEGNILSGFANILGTFCGCLFATWVGMVTGRLI
jgi:CrcB protein